MNTDTLVLLLVFQNMSCCFWMIMQIQLSNSKSSASGCYLAFTWFFTNFSLALLIKVLLTKKVCISIFEVKIIRSLVTMMGPQALLSAQRGLKREGNFRFDCNILTHQATLSTLILAKKWFRKNKQTNHCRRWIFCLNIYFKNVKQSAVICQSTYSLKKSLTYFQRMFSSYRNQLIDLLCKSLHLICDSTDYFLYDGNIAQRFQWVRKMELGVWEAF